MDIWTADKLIIFLLFVIPGFISLKTYGLISNNIEKDSSKQIIDAIAYSSVNYAILLAPIIFIEISDIYKTNPISYYFFYLFVFFFAPIIWVFIWKYLRSFQHFAPHPTEKVWDYVFSQHKEYWIIITLINGNTVGGKYSTNSFTSSSANNEQIYLEESWIINSNRGFEREKNNTDGILVMQNQISYIEFVKYT